MQVAPFPDPIGCDVIVRWPGGVAVQLYWHATAPSYPALQTIPENRVYLSPDRVAAFVRSLLAFSGGQVTSDDPHAPGVDIGRPGDNDRRVRITSGFGRITVLATDGHLPHPYGRETTGYEVVDLTTTLDRVRTAGVTVLVQPHDPGRGASAMVEFPGGYVAELHVHGR